MPGLNKRASNQTETTSTKMEDINEKEKVFYGIQNGKTIYVSGTSRDYYIYNWIDYTAYSGNSVFTDKLGWNVGRKNICRFSELYRFNERF